MFDFFAESHTVTDNIEGYFRKGVEGYRGQWCLESVNVRSNTDGARSQTDGDAFEEGEADFGTGWVDVVFWHCGGGD